MEWAKNALLSVLFFLGRLLRDMWLEIWKPIRKGVVKCLPWVLVAVGVLWLVKSNPEGFKAIAGSFLTLAIALFGFKIMFRGIFPKKKK